jgi:hypothetical protein
MKPELEELVRRAMRNMDPDYVADENEKPLSGTITREEAAEVEAEIARRVYARFAGLWPRIAPQLAHFPAEQRAALEQAFETELARALAPMGKRPGLN